MDDAAMRRDYASREDKHETVRPVFALFAASYATKQKSHAV